MKGFDFVIINTNRFEMNKDIKLIKFSLDLVRIRL